MRYHRRVQSRRRALASRIRRNFRNLRLGLFHMNGMAIEDPNWTRGYDRQMRGHGYSRRQNAAVPFKRSRHVPGFDLATCLKPTPPPPARQRRSETDAPAFDNIGRIVHTEIYSAAAIRIVKIDANETVIRRATHAVTAFEFALDPNRSCRCVALSDAKGPIFALTYCKKNSRKISPLPARISN